MLFDELPDFCIPAEPGAYALMLVQGHADSVSCTAEGDSQIYITLFYSCGKRMG